MKNLKKVLALVLAFACAFTMFAGAVVYPDVPAGSEYSEAITMLSDLGIIQGKDDGKYHSEDTITRAEACALIARMLTGDPQVSQYAGASNFTDVVKGSWKESVVGYCVVNGITVGVGNNKFEPDRAITDAEFVTMVVRAMGYETTGTSYPYGHISAAQANGLLDDVTVVPSSAALRGEDAQIIYNALFADYARGAKQVNTTHGTTVEEYPTIAEDVFGLSRAAVGTWGTKDEEDILKSCKAHTWVIVRKVCEEGKVNKIEVRPIEDGETDLYDDKIYTFTYEGDVDALKGYQVELWGEGQHGQPELEKTADKTKVYAFDWEIKAIKTVKGQSAYDYNPTMNDGKDNDKIKFEDTEVKVNKAQVGNKTEAQLNVKNAASYTLIDWDSDDTIDAIVEDTPDYYEVASVSKSKVKLNNFAGKTVYTLDTDGETDVDDVTIKADLPDDLEEGDVIAVTTSCVSSKKDVVSTWTVEVVEPEAMEVTDVSSKKGVYFDGELLEVADKKSCFGGADDTYNKMNEKSEDMWDVWQDANGYIIKLEVSDETWAGYMFVTGQDNGNNATTSAGTRKKAVVSFVDDKNEYHNSVKLVKDADVLVYDYDKVDASAKKYDADEMVDMLDDYVFDDVVIGRAFKYQVNDDGEITKMVQVASERIANGFSYDEDNYSLKPDTVDPEGAPNRKMWINDADVIFAVEIEAWATQNGDIDEDAVIAVDADEIPDISGSKTNGWAVMYDVTDKTDKVDAAVLVVDSLRYFKNTSVKAGLVTGMTYHKSSDTYTIDAYVAGMDDDSFTTIDKDDVAVDGLTGTAATTKLDKMNAKVNATNGVHGIYCEIEFNKDGKIAAIAEMSKTTDTSGLYTYTTTANHTYKVVRAVVNRNTIRERDYLKMAPAKTNGDGDLYTVFAGAFDEAPELLDSTAYYKITENNFKFSTTDRAEIKVEDAFKKEFDTKSKSPKVVEGSIDDLESDIQNTAFERDDEYVVADVIIDEGDVVAVYYNNDTIDEAIEGLAGSVTVANDFTYDPVASNHVNLTVDVDDDIITYVDKVTFKFNGVTYTVKGDELNPADGTWTSADIDTTGWAAGEYPITDAVAYSKIDGASANGYALTAGKLTVDKATMHLTLAIDGKTYTDAKLTGAVEGLSYNNFVVSVNDVVVEEAFDYDLRYDVTEGVYHFEFDRYLSDGDVVTVAVKDVANYNDTETLATVDPAPTTVEVLSVAGKNLITVKAANVPAGATWTVSFDGREYSATAAPNGDKYVLTVGDPVIATNPDCDFTQSHDAYTVEVSVNGASGTLVVTPA